MSYRFMSLAFVVAAFATTPLFAQKAAPPRVGPQQTFGNSGLRQNAFEANKPVATINEVITPLPLSASLKKEALGRIEQHIAGDVKDLAKKVKSILPDELAMLAKTAGWKPEHQQALVVALRAVDPAAVYQAWTQGNAQDTAGAELAARQTDVRKSMAKLSQDVEKDFAAVGADLNELDTALTKIATATPGAADLTGALNQLRTWEEAHKLVDDATPSKGSVVKLPTGEVKLIYDPSLSTGTTIVLSDKAMLIGFKGQGQLKLATGNAAEAIGLPVINDEPLPDTQGDQIADCVFIVNPSTSRGMVNYNVNGNHYVSKAGMAQRLPAGRAWVIEFDRGEKFGPATYTVTPGTYYFTPTDMGWQLYRQKYEVTLDNTKNEQEFHFVFQGKDMTVPANGSRTITSDFPIVLGYDRGNDEKFVKKSLAFSGHVQIGINPTDNRWDLFPTSQHQREVSSLAPFTVR